MTLRRQRMWSEELRSAAHHLAVAEADRLIHDATNPEQRRLDEDPIAVAESILGLSTER